MKVEEHPIDDKAPTGGDGFGGAQTRPVLRVRWPLVMTILIPLIILNCGWVANSEIRNNITEQTVSTLFMGVLFMLFGITLINLAVRRFFGAKAGLNQAEMMALYTLLSTSSAVCGTSYMGFFALAAISPANFAAVNHVNNFMAYLPHYFGPRDPKVVLAFYQGHTSFFAPYIWKAWVTPLIFWSLFLLVLLWTVLCLSAALRQRWADEEHLPFPVIALPLEITREGAPIYRAPALWFGFAIPCFLHSLNTLHGFYPNLPSYKINSFYDLSQNLTYPWTGVGAMFFMIHPVGVGFGYLVGTDVSFSLWFFYLLKKALSVFGVVCGWRQPDQYDWDANNLPQFPFITFQGIGAWIAVGLTAIWTGRSYFRAYFQRAVHGDPTGIDRGEAMSARLAVLGAILGFLILCGLVWVDGGSIWLPVAFFGLYILLMLAVSRIRAATAMLQMSLNWIYPQDILPDVLGTRSLSTIDLTHIGMLTWFNADYRSVIMPTYLEGLVAMRRVRGALPPLVWAILIASAISIVSAAIWDLQMYYVNGASTAGVASWRNNATALPWKNLESWLRSPTTPTTSSLVAMAFGFAFTFLLDALRNRFVGFPFHPAAYVLNMSSSNDCFWVDMFVAWLAKSLIMRYGGLKGYQQALPFFLGLILGDFVTGAAWCLFGTVFHISGLFRTFPV